jgi:hypothetical protein
VFEIFNEPFKTQGWHVTEKYHEFLEAARMAVEKSNKDIEIMRCGLGYLSRDPDANLTATMLSDLTSEHGYATYNDSKQWIKKVAPKAEYYRKHNLKRDIWWTEYGKYVHDEPNYIYDRFDHFLGNKDECTSTAYSIKYLTILFSHGVTKVFFHSRFWPLCINKMWNGVYFDMHFKYGALPMKFFPACNAFAYLIPPGSSGGTPLMEDGPVFAYSFENEDEKILVFWTDKQEVKLEKEIVPDNVNLRTYDMMGGPLRTLRSAGDEPVYVIGKKSAVDAIAASLQ